MEAVAGPVLRIGDGMSEPCRVSMKVSPKQGNLIENAYIARIIAYAI
jgi:hypothetical protein